MLTKNFYNYMLSKMAKRTITNGLVTTSGAVCDAVFGANTTSDNMLNYIFHLVATQNTQGVTIGNGTTPATADDYKLESINDTGFSVVTPSGAAITKDDDGVSIFATYAITNTGTEALVISEIGLTGRLYVSSSTDSALLDRTVLDTPITINPGEAKNLTYTIRLNYPTE